MLSFKSLAGQLTFTELQGVARTVVVCNNKVSENSAGHDLVVVAFFLQESQIVPPSLHDVHWGWREYIWDKSASEL